MHRTQHPLSTLFHSKWWDCPLERMSSRCTEHATFALATPSTPLEPGVIAGRVWHDLCATTGSEGGVPASPSEGRIPEAGSGCRANGRMEQDARLSIEVRDAAGRIAEEAVEERLADVAGC